MNCWGNLTNCGEVTCDGQASRPGGVEILLVASCYEYGDKLWQLHCMRQTAPRLHTFTQLTLQCCNSLLVNFLQDKLSKKFKVQGIPTLILLDGKDGKVITKDARSNLLEDPAGENFPWRPKGLTDVMKGVKLVNNKKEEKAFEDLAGKVIAFYFSAHWVCIQCQALFSTE